MMVVLLGCHGAGKTSLGRALGRELRWPFHEELGRLLAADPGLRPPHGSAEDAQQSFDDAVFSQELRRDLGWAPGSPRLVETWHPGNLAYAHHRGSRIADKMQDEIEKNCAAFSPVVLPVLAPRDVLARRQSEPGDLHFFLSVAGSALAWAERLRIPVLPPVWTHLDTPSALASTVARQLRAGSRASLTSRSLS